ncbi:radical SAM/SPASM domain-containing protein [Paenibacillus tarimensis]|uniref:radical SAM/SPASM domain-containing protein n=1 Tax=Paenibacillus tarimensis TaxID=416012 RepID=UPI001F270D72|nr:radical SAM protein [Paenibacillus tarimensis]MCF2945799.1 radical SAM protein [Paenibacillus tarimensis]
MHSNRYRLEYPLGQETLVINTLNGAIDVFPNELVQLLHKLPELNMADMTREQTEAISYLKSRNYVYHSKAEEEQLLEKAMVFARKTQVMQYVICPTYTCNFRCPYCFESHDIHDKISLLTDEQLDAVWQAVEYFHQDSGLQQGMFNLFGGEPLLPFTRPIVEKICEKAVELDFKIGCNTNGFHLHAFLDLLTRYRDRLKLTITVDGPEEIHDQRRILSSGKGTFQRIEKNIESALDCGISVLVRINIDKTNIETVPTLVEHYMDNGMLGRPGFKVHFAPVTDHTCQSTGDTIMQGIEILRHLRRNIPTIDELEKKEQVLVGSDMYRYIYAVSKLDPELQQKAIPFLPNIVFCESVQGRKITFGPDNHIYACADLIGRPEFKIGDYYPDFQLKEWKWEKWKAFNSLTIPQCRGCSSAPICGGGCAAEALVTYGNLDQPHCTHAGEKVMSYLDSIRDDLIKI